MRPCAYLCLFVPHLSRPRRQVGKGSKSPAPQAPLCSRSELGGKGWHRFAITHPPAGKRSAAASFFPPCWPLTKNEKPRICGAWR